MHVVSRLLLNENGMRRSHGLFGIVMLLLVGCASTSEHYQTRPFFLIEEDIVTHGSKRIFDRMIETDPGVTEYTVAADYQEHPPRRIAVLLFVDHGNGDYTVDKISLGFARARKNLTAQHGRMPIGCDVR
jgi:hypothetical protein